MNRAEAMAVVLGEIAATTDTIRLLCGAQVEFGHTTEAHAMTDAAGLLARHAGHLADRLGRTCGDPGRQCADAWLHDPLTVEALVLLESGASR